MDARCDGGIRSARSTAGVKTEEQQATLMVLHARTLAVTMSAAASRELLFLAAVRRAAQIDVGIEALHVPLRVRDGPESERLVEPVCVVGHE